MISIFLQCAALVFVYMTAFFIIAQLKRDNSVVDIGWGIGFVLIALFTFFKFSSWLPRQILATAMTLAWGARLSGYIYIRARGKKEDQRYTEFRKRWGKYALIKSFLEVFMLQGFFMLLIAIPIIFINSINQPGLTLIDAFGFLLWQAGLIIESIADSQLAQFLSDPENKGHIMQYGLWKFTRHPNYSGELCIWFGIWILTLSLPFGLFTIIGPLVLTFIFIFFSIPITEQHLKANPAYREYQKTTKSLIPFIY